MKKKIIFLLFFCVALVSGVFLFFIYQVSHSTGELDENATFKIEKGEGVKIIAERLEKAGIISRDKYFLYYVWKNKIFSDIKTGEFIFYPKITIPEIAAMLTGGDEKNRQVKVTFPEGWNRKQMAARLGENGFSETDFLEKTENFDWAISQHPFLGDLKASNLEGFLFPDTYYFFRDASTADIINKMLDNFEDKVDEDLPNLSEVVTLASIIEKEVRTGEDRRIVSGIFLKRIADGRALQSCATLAFILGENKRQYSVEDTLVASPYNTYLNAGLPPGPISNPGLDSIKAVLEPTTTAYNYFLSDPETGQTVFSKTIEEHNQNKVKYNL